MMMQRIVSQHLRWTCGYRAIMIVSDVAAELQMLLPAGLRVLGAYGQAHSGDGAAVQAAADALVAAVPAQLVGIHCT